MNSLVFIYFVVSVVTDILFKKEVEVTTFAKTVQRLCCDNERGTGKGVPIGCMQASQHSLFLE